MKALKEVWRIIICFAAVISFVLSVCFHYLPLRFERCGNMQMLYFVYAIPGLIGLIISLKSIVTKPTAKSILILCTLEIAPSCFALICFVRDVFPMMFDDVYVTLIISEFILWLLFPVISAVVVICGMDGFENASEYPNLIMFILSLFPISVLAFDNFRYNAPLIFFISARFFAYILVHYFIEEHYYRKKLRREFYEK